jgi:hypothetical protein
MMTRRLTLTPALTLLAALVTCAALLALPARAAASGSQETILQDDDQLIYASPEHMAHTLEQLSALGVDRVKVSMVWWLVASHPNSYRRPRFDATNPAKYPPGAWDRYDMLVRMAHELGLKVYFELSPPDPHWAIPKGEATHQAPPLGHAPDPKLFAQFVKAVGRRYSGSFDAPVPAQQPSPAALGLSDSYTDGLSPAIPRVDYWGIWNEPNERSWLNPYYKILSNHKRAIIQAAVYRGLANAAWGALAATGHTAGRDTILIGETANAGVLAPTAFVRALYCVSSGSRPLTGSAASLLGCPTAGNRRQFAVRNPGLFKISGFAHHPYGFNVAPNRPYRNPPTFVTLHNLGGFKHALDGAFAAYGQHRHGGVQLYLTEWGYKTKPPNPYQHTSLTQQQVWLDQGAYMAWRLSWVQALAQFLLVDDKPKAGEKKGSLAYWSTFQTGLKFLNGTPKPAYYSFSIPIWLPSANHRHATVWGDVRPAHEFGGVTAQLQFEANGSSDWSTVEQIQTRGFVLTHVSLPAAGHVRLAWLDKATGTTHYSRTAAVS